MEHLTGKKFWVIVGTRPEVIKQVPVYWALCNRFGRENVALISSGQHRELLDQAMQHFGVTADAEFALMKDQQSLYDSAGRALQLFGRAMAENAPEWVLVQGDTTTAAMAAWAAFQTKCRLLHVEAGLRSYDLDHPFPEEGNRRLISIVAQRNAAPTENAKTALLREGIREETIRVTGNTGIDALVWTMENKIKKPTGGCDRVLITAHRRENSSAFQRYFSVVREFCETRPDLQFIMPIHPNNLARGDAQKYFSTIKNIELVAPLSYLETCELLSRALFVVTDSGGVQEEAASLGARVVVCRETTERAEAVTAGLAVVASAEDSSKFLSALEWAASGERRDASGKIRYPIFGDGNAANCIAEWLAEAT